MDKKIIIKEKSQFIDWANSLKNISDYLWFKPFKDGAWGTAEVISHFISWDKFVIENRIQYLIKNETFPELNVDVETINQKAAEFAKSGISKEDLINEFVSVRTELISYLNELSPEQFNQPYPVNPSITLNQYFVGLIEHDVKHKEQIDLHIKDA